MRLVLAALLCAAAAFAQQQPAAAPAPSFLAQLGDPLTIALASYDLSQVAAGTTDWKFTLGGKHYTVNPAQQTAIATAVTIGAAAAAHKWPKLKTPLTIVLTLVSGYYGGLAYGRANSHGTPAPAATSAAIVIRK